MLAAALLLTAVAGEAAGPGDRRAPGSPRVVDGAGRTVGTPQGLSITGGLYAQVLLRVDGVPYLVLVGQDAFVAATGSIGFESANCLGQRFTAPFRLRCE